jgi:hypothetical protein
MAPSAPQRLMMGIGLVRFWPLMTGVLAVAETLAIRKERSIMLESYVRAPAQRGAEWCAASVPREMAATGASAGACVKECAVSGGGGGGDACGGATRRSSRHVSAYVCGFVESARWNN